MNIDCTYSAQVRTVDAMRNALEYLRNVQNKHMKPSGIIESTVYFNKGSEHGGLKVYIKVLEFFNQLKELKKLNKTCVYDNAIAVMSDTRLQAYLANLLRFEATLTKRKLNDLGICSTFIGFCKTYEQYRQSGRNFIESLFMTKTAPLFDSLSGITMNIFDDEKVKKILFTAYTKHDKKGRVNDALPRSLLTTFRNITRDGYLTTKESMSKPTFNRHIKMMTDAGISKAQLQNAFRERMHNNVVPLLQIINVDFGNQFPDWYVEPVSQYADNNVVSLQNRRISHSLKMAI
jgi:II/X family phage/plasmid replication protein